MYPAPFEYHRPASVEEAVALLGAHGDAKLLAGGHSLIPLLKLRFAQPAHLIDVRRIPGLAGIGERDGAIVIGAATTHAALARSELLARVLPIVPEAASQIGDAQVRNMGTIGGSLAHGDPAADLPAVMLATDAELTAVGPHGPRTIPADAFFVDLLTTALEPTEVLTRVRIPLPASATGGAYEKYPHPASRYALVGVAVMLTVSGGTIARARVAITGVGARATREGAVERALTGERPSDALFASAAEHVAEGVELRSDVHGSAEWRRGLAVAYTRRALTRAAARAARG
ncbi:MAG TPA: xanthine dehydrogenase family protein subunit M [Gemmatimonadaceae bacterium]